jgi:hypothetical protein
VRLGRTLLDGGAPFVDLVALDIDGDGLEDLVATREGIGVIALRNLGGDFEAESTLVPGATSLRARGLVDVDQDGVADLVLAGVSGPGLGWCRALGAGTFGPVQPIWPQTESITEATIADIDVDGDLDVVAVTTSADIVLAALGGGTPGTMQRVVLATLPTSHFTQQLDPLVGDLDGDGLPEVLFESNSGILSLPNMGGLVFGPPRTVISSSASPMDLVDVDRDGDLDLFQAFFVPYVVLNDGAGNLSQFVTLTPSNAHGPSAAWGDQDGDGWPDLVQIGGNFTGAFWYPNLATGVAPYLGPRLTLGGGLAQPWRILALDADADGDQDLAVLDRGRSSVTLLATVGGEPLESLVSSTGSTQPVPIDMHAADLDGDGVLDLVTSTFFELQVLLGRGDGSYQPATPIALTGPGTSAYGSLAAPVDVDGDGDLDLVTSIGTSAAAGPSRIVWFPGDGLGNFGPESAVTGTLATYIDRVRAADVDADGLVDVVAYRFSGDSVALWRGVGGGAFAGATAALTGGFNSDEALEDLDGDGQLDLVALVGPFPGHFVWVPSAGATGAVPQVLAAAPYATDFRFGDVDGDGRRDIVVQRRVANGPNQRELAVLLRTGPTSFGPLTSAVQMFDVAVQWTLVDLDGDQDLDVAWSGNLQAEVGLVRNLRFGTFGQEYCEAVPNSTGSEGHLRALGDPSLGQGALRLAVTEVPAFQSVLVLAGRTRTSVFPVPSSVGRLCVGGPLGRFAGQVLASGPAGQAWLDVDLGQLPTPTGAVAAQPGETWTFQAWHRDAGPSGPSSNFTRAVAVVFQP